MWLWTAMAGCAEPVVGSFLGDPFETAKLGVALTETDATLYFSGVDATLATDTRWFEASRGEDDALTGTSDDGWTLEGAVDTKGEVVYGNVIDPDGIELPFSASRPDDPSTIDGLWEADAPTSACRVGVIVFNAAYQVRGAFCPTEGAYVPLAPVDLTVDDQGRIVVEALTDPPTELPASPVYRP